MSDTATFETATGRQPRADKVAVVDEIAAKLNDAGAVFVTRVPRHDRRPSWPAFATSLRASDAEHKVYKNTLARFAVRERRPRGPRGAPRRPDRPHVRAG